MIYKNIFNLFPFNTVDISVYSTNLLLWLEILQLVDTLLNQGVRDNFVILAIP